MRYRMHRKPDLIAVLALVVGLGVLISMRVQAQEALAVSSLEGLAGLPVEGARMAVSPVRDLAGRLQLRWVEERLADESVADFVAGSGMYLNRPHRTGDGVVRLRWRAPGSFRDAERAARDMGASLNGPRAPRTGIFITFDKHW